MKDQGTIVAMAAVAAGCVLCGMLRGDNTVFIIGLAFGIPAYLLFRKRYKEGIREKYGEVKKPPSGKNTPKGGAGNLEG
ncbi:MAG: hypothetical protein JXL84_18920 [Deltaproteobacteria bacterium]|nr:hypothetical protein [Deltaproteobacteria bacterium]